MVPERSWLYPAIGFRDFLNRYPFVFLFGFLCAFCWVLQFSTVWFYNSFNSLNRAIGYSPWIYTFFFGVPLFALLHLVVRSPVLQRIKYRFLLYVLGIMLLYFFYNYLVTTDITWLIFTHWFDMTGLAAFLWPLLGWKLTKEEHHDYFWDFLKRLLAAFLVYLILTALFIFIPLSLCELIMNLSNIFPDLRFQLPRQINDFAGPASQTASFLVYPWFLLGGLDNFLNPGTEKREEASAPGPKVTFWVFIVTVLLFIFEGWKVFIQWRAHQINYVMDEKSILLLSAILSMALVRNQKGDGWEKWKWIYSKCVSGLALIFLVVAFTLKNTNGSYSGLATIDVYSFYVWLWYLGVFVYFFWRQKSGWEIPVVALWGIMVLTLVGPLNPSAISLDSHEKVLKAKMTEAGMLKDGSLVKFPDGSDAALFLPVQNCLYWFTRTEGLNWLRGAFPPELKDLDWSTAGTEAHLPQLLDWLGRDRLNNAPTHKPNVAPMGIRYSSFSTGTGMGGVQRIEGNDVQNFSMPQRVQPHRDTGYCLLMPAPGESIVLFYNNEFLAKIPLSGLAHQLAPYDNKDRFHPNVKPKDMSLVYANSKVKVKLYFSRIETSLENGELKIRSGSGILFAKRK